MKRIDRNRSIVKAAVGLFMLVLFFVAAFLVHKWRSERFIKQCRASSPEHYVELMFAEYMGGIPEELWVDGPSLAMTLMHADPAEELMCSEEIPDMFACKCEKTIILRLNGMGGPWREAFGRDDSELAWARKCTDFNAYCENRSFCLSYGKDEEIDDCDCIPVNARKQDLEKWIENGYEAEQLFLEMKELHESRLGHEACGDALEI